MAILRQTFKCLIARDSSDHNYRNTRVRVSEWDTSIVRGLYDL